MAYNARMPGSSHLPLQAPASHWRQLILIRSVLVLALALAASLASRAGVVQLPLMPVLVTLVWLSALNGLSVLRLRRASPVRHWELLIQLTLDVITVAILAYYTGGATNPFLAYLLVPVCIAAAILPKPQVWALSALATSLYGALLVWYHPLALLAPAAGHGAMNWHVVGMWLNFSLSAALISYFVARMAATVRRQQDELNAKREEDLRDEQLLAVATQAAGTAHELGTPLATMKVLLSDMARDPAASSACGEDLTIVHQQLTHCGEILTRLRERADLEQLANPPQMPLRYYCQALIDHWQLLRPAVTADVRLEDSLDDTPVRYHPTIEQAITNVLNNAADASPQALYVRVYRTDGALVWDIDDKGEGLARGISGRLGRRPTSTKAHGLGLGLFLTHASIQRYRGTVELTPRADSGTRTRITLPLENRDG